MFCVGWCILCQHVVLEPPIYMLPCNCLSAVKDRDTMELYSKWVHSRSLAGVTPTSVSFHERVSCLCHMTALPPVWLQAPAMNLALHSTKHKYSLVLPPQGPWCYPEIPPLGLLWCWSLNSLGNTHYAVSSRSFCLLIAIWLQINSVLPSNPSPCPLELTTSSKTSLKVKQNRAGSYFLIEPGIRCTATVLSVPLGLYQNHHARFWHSTSPILYYIKKETKQMP